MSEPEGANRLWLARELSRRELLGGAARAGAAGLLLSAPELLLACGGTTPSTTGEKVSGVKIAAVVSLTGINAVYAQGARDGAKQVFDAVNASGGLAGLGGAKIDYAVYDSQGVPATAQTLTQRAYDEGAVIVLGCGDGASALTATQAAAQAGKPFITGDPTDTVTTRNLKGVFQPAPLTGVYARQLADTVLDVVSSNRGSIKKATIVRVEIATFNAVAPILEDYLKGKGVAVTNVSYPSGQSTFSSVAAAAKGADAVIQLALPADAVGTIRAMKVAGASPPIMAGLIAAYTDPKFFVQLGPDAEGLMGLVQFSPDLPYSWLKKEVDTWSASYPNRPIDAFSAVYLTCGAVAVDALNRAKSTKPDAIINALKSTTLTNKDRFVTIPGGVKFDAAGKNTQGSGVAIQYQNGKLVVIGPKPAPAKPIYPKPNWT